jgi:hypothetical protein
MEGRMELSKAELKAELVHIFLVLDDTSDFSWFLFFWWQQQTYLGYRYYMSLWSCVALVLGTAIDQIRDGGATN